MAQKGAQAKSTSRRIPFDFFCRRKLKLSPSHDQIEVTIAGPGRGECCIIHIGDGRWIIVDSFINRISRRSFALDYLLSIGVDVSTSVRLIIATHWHDDHIGGMAELVSSCPAAKFICSNALRATEFLTFVDIFATQSHSQSGSGVAELYAILAILKGRGRKSVDWGVANKTHLRLPSEESAHGREIEYVSLSPSDKQIELSLREIAALLPGHLTAQYRASAQGPNHLSTASYLKIGEIGILLGADLEETGKNDTGWRAIVSSQARPLGRGTIFKIPHHGSVTGYYQPVWDEMLVRDPICIVTPYLSGRKPLPSKSDIDRMRQLTTNLHATRLPSSRSPVRRSSSVERTIREMTVAMYSIVESASFIVLRNGGRDRFAEWDIARHGRATAI